MFLDVFSVKNISDYYVPEIPTIAYKAVTMDEKMEFFQDISSADFATHSGVPGGGGSSGSESKKWMCSTSRSNSPYLSTTPP